MLLSSFWGRIGIPLSGQNLQLVLCQRDMQRNASKRMAISVCRSDESILRIIYAISRAQVCSAARLYLGVLLNQILITPDDHRIETICCRSSKLLGLFWHGSRTVVCQFTPFFHFTGLFAFHNTLKMLCSGMEATYYIHHIAKLQKGLRERLWGFLGLKWAWGIVQFQPTIS